MRTVFVSGTRSPFQVELGSAIRERGIDYRLAFDEPTLRDRGGHWDHFTRAPWIAESRGETSRSAWIESQLAAAKPTLVLCGGAWGSRLAACARYAARAGVPLGIYAEQPHPRPGLIAFPRNLAIAGALRRSARFVLAIGPRAREQYVALLGRPQDVHEVSYFQDLRPARNPAREYVPDECRFVFSGRLLRRNRPDLLLRAFASVVERARTRVSLTLAADGPEAGWVRRYLDAHPEAAARVSWRTAFETWSARLDPLKQADVLVVPAEHSGWALVVPEALTAGALVIATHRVEAARSMVCHLENGLLCEPTFESVAEAMSFVAEEPAARIRMQRRAAGSAARFDVIEGARAMAEVLGRYS